MGIRANGDEVWTAKNLNIGQFKHTIKYLKQNENNKNDLVQINIDCSWAAFSHEYGQNHQEVINTAAKF
eukprot:117334-Ditylum_brightwellii.AAC.1